MHVLVYEYSPDIIIGCESQIDNSYSSAEVFPPGYCVFRKDRCEGAGGVFICIKENLSVSTISSLDTDVTSPTRGNNTLDLTFSSQPIISHTSIVPGMSDHEAI